MSHGFTDTQLITGILGGSEKTAAFVSSALDISLCEPEQTVLSTLKAAGLSIRQIERLTGINRNIIQRAE